MILTIAEARQFVTTSDSDQVLGWKLQALELLIRSYTHNNFQDRRFRTLGNVDGNILDVRDASFFNVGDTIMIDDDLCVIAQINGSKMTLDKSLLFDEKCLVTKIVYPMDVKMGVANMLKWQYENGDKVGVQSETISRHSVTYFNMDGDNSTIGYPKSLVGFLKPYMKARF